MKVFISQPMNGRSEKYILTKRDTLIAKVKRWFGCDIEIIDSYTKSPEIEAKGSVAMLGHSIMLMADADLVILSCDWESARGCRIEKEVARSYDIPILIESEENAMFNKKYKIAMKILDEELV